MNRNAGRFLIAMHLNELDGAEQGIDKDYLWKIEDAESNSEVYFFEPSWHRDRWSILVLRYTSYWTGLPNHLQDICDTLRETLQADYTELPA